MLLIKIITIVFANHGNDALLWLEFGKDGNLISSTREFPLSNKVRVELFGFTMMQPWGLHHGGHVKWNIVAQHEGRIELFFDGNQMTDKVALFVTDGDSRIRTSRIRSDRADIIADKLLEGKWILLPITEEEKAQGKKTIKITPLTGSGAAISSLVILIK
jgi:hypothetical protein